MRFNKLLAGMALLIGSSILSGCNNEPLEIPQSELYAREFYKTFGLVSPDQDWTAASRGALTVTTDKPTDISIIADVDGTTYLFGQFKAVDGQKVLDFDIPKHATNIEAIAGGKHYPIEKGDRLNLSSAGSRNETNSHGAGEIDTETGLGESGTYAGVEVTIQPNEYGRYLTLEPETMTEALKKLEENPREISEWKYSNMNVEGVYDNFSVTAKEFFLFPEYWQTSHAADNIIGIYWEVEQGTEDAENILITDPDGTEHSYWIIRIPVMQNPSKLLTPCKNNTVTYENFSDIPNWEDIFKALVKNYPESYYITDGSQLNEYGVSIEPGKKYHVFKDGKAREISTTRDQETWGDINHEVGSDIASIYPVFYIHEWGLLAQNELIDSPYSGDNPSDALLTGTVYYKSHGIHITLDQARKFGFYIQQFDKVMYSQTKLNEWVTKLNDEGEEEARQPSYTATYVEGSDTEGNDKRHLCFEDWHKDNWDINDMIFRVYGFDYLKNPEKPIETGKVTNESPTPTPDPKPDPKPDPVIEEIPTYPWIVACEDLGATDDYDFNDIVFGVEHVAGTRYVYVTALAAGGTLPARLYYTTDGTNRIQITGGETDDSNDPQNGNQYTVSSPDGSKYFDEWHKWFGSGRFSTEMINTRGNFSIGATVRITLSKENADKFSLSNEKKPSVSTDASISHIGGFTVEVDQEGGKVNEIKAPVITDNPADNIPQLFATTYKYKWPYERESIKKTHAGTNEVVGTTPGGVTYNKGSFMHWVIAGDDANFHETEPSLPGMTCNHGWKGDLKRVKVTDKDGNVQEYYEAYGNKFKAE